MVSRLAPLRYRLAQTRYRLTQIIKLPVGRLVSSGMSVLLRVTLPICTFLTLSAQARFPGLTLPPSGNNQKAEVIQYIGPVRVSVSYSSPAVHGPDGKDRRGQIWGKLVPYGLVNLGFGTAKESPWRAGANENTVFAISDDVLIEGQSLKAGQYGLHMIPGQDEWTIVFSRDSAAWGSFYYDPAHDALRVKVKPHGNPYREWLTYDFSNRKPGEATLELQWEELAIPVAIRVERVNDLYITRLKQDLTTTPGFHWQAFSAAAQFAVTVENLPQALEWADAAAGMPFIGVANFETLTLKAQILEKLGRNEESDKLVQQALRLPTTTALEIHMFGRRLMSEKKSAEAMKVFQYNAERNGDAWPVHVGLARGYAAAGKNSEALEHARKALTQAPDEVNRKNLEAMVKTLSEGHSLDQ